MPKFLTIHNESNLDRVLLESRWTEIAFDPRASWEMTLFGTDPGERFCEWDAPDHETIEEIFRELGIKWTEIIEIDVTVASAWRSWQLESGRGKKKCWEVMDCGREPEIANDDTGFCPAAVNSRVREGDGELFSGRYCWKVTGVRCHEKVAGTLSEGLIESSSCPFFRNGGREERPTLQM